MKYLFIKLSITYYTVLILANVQITEPMGSIKYIYGLYNYVMLLYKKPELLLYGMCCFVRLNCKL